ncbi:sarcosine oxidase subunit gamma [Pseudorhodobacter sp. W20_MBD10_FR17]|uniref:sarcosine oxidase subunit gamma n=1 Tax=Pseudorhodobacter sp. W20_MBD10_FR17 TaxID=3240266 RepID=UPI003F979B4F
MVNLIAKTPLWGHTPIALAGVTLAELDLGQVTSVAPFGAVQGFPAPNCVLACGDARLVWAGRGQAFLIGGSPAAWADKAALTDQGDAWACLSVTGAGAVDVLARLVPIDLRTMGSGGCARSCLGHMAAIFIAVSGGFEVMVPRSMAKTAWHEVEAAMRMRSARLLC